MMIGIGEADEQVPAIEHQRDAASHQAAALEVARREAAPTPLVFNLSSTIAVELVNSENLTAQRGDQNGLFPNLVAIVDLGKANPELTLGVAFGECQ